MSKNFEGNDFYRELVCLVTALIFFFSIMLNCFVVVDLGTEISFPGYTLLVTGGIAFLGGGMFESFVWLANPLLILAVVTFLKRNKASVFFGFVSFLIALSFTGFSEVLVSEGGREAVILQLKIGYWLWLLSHLLFLSGAVYFFQTRKILFK